MGTLVLKQENGWFSFITGIWLVKLYKRNTGGSGLQQEYKLYSFITGIQVVQLYNMNMGDTAL